jgi:hypothetical protein
MLCHLTKATRVVVRSGSRFAQSSRSGTSTRRLTSSPGNVGGSLLGLITPPPTPNHVNQPARRLCMQAPTAHGPQPACVTGGNLLLWADPTLFFSACLRPSTIGCNKYESSWRSLGDSASHVWQLTRCVLRLAVINNIPHTSPPLLV